MGEAGSGTRTAFRTCPLCEATCGLEITVAGNGDGEQVVRIRGDRDDVFSHGFICPKGSTLKQLHEDPDVLRRPLVKRDGEFVEVSWDEAFEEIERRLPPIADAHGPDAVAAYVGNPNAHNLGAIYLRGLLKALRTKNLFSASTVDQMPKHVSAGLMFGHALTIPVPDLDRTDYLLMLGANPWESNGSLCTAPDFPGRVESIRERGGKVVVVDPRRSKTAEHADEHVFIRPGTDPLFLFGVVHVLFEEGPTDLSLIGDHVNGVEEVERLAAAFSPERVAPACGVDAGTIRRLARELAAAPSAAVYGRIGTCTVEFGTLGSWLVDVVNVLTGNLDRPGGAMFAEPAHAPRKTEPGGRGYRMGKWESRVRGLPERNGELPVATLADEIETPGEGQVRALITVAGNPVISTPNAGRLDAALDSLDFMVSVDIYVNETTRHADVILPVPTALSKSHYDVALYALQIRKVANYSPPVFERPEGMPDEWEVILRLTAVLLGLGAHADLDALDDFAALQLVQSAVAVEGSPVAGRDPDELMAELAPRRGPERLLDLMLRTGPYGDGFGADPDGISLATLEANPHGIDLGPLTPRVPTGLATPSGKVELAPQEIVADVPRLEASLDRHRNGDLVLVGRRHLRSNNSWMHNVHVLVKGKERCTLQIHPDDAASVGVADGGLAEVASRVGKVTVPVEVTAGIMPGVVSIPHGWGHDVDGIRMSVASQHAGVNSNLLADEEQIDPLSGNAVLNGIPVTVAPA
ncbi:MAG: molybdopterin oxidoreductase family protein [Actinobacteria bacterium]|nr:molybdopterin oxidoreductase family protein [Actinomycetota bacterium]